MKRVFMIAAACAPLLAACATGEPRAPDLRLPAAYEAPSRGAALPAAALDRWWTLYDDPQLNALVEEALGKGFDARTAASRLAQARAVRQSALNAYNPQGNVAGSAKRTHTDTIDGGVSIPANSPFADLADLFTQEGDADSFSLGFNVSWELDLFGRRAATRRSADADLRSAEFNYEAARASLAASVADSLFVARGLAMQLKEAQDAQRLQESLFRVADIKSDRGLTPSSDAAQTEANLQTTRAQAEALQAQLTAARRSLLLLLGRATGSLADLQITPAVGSPPATPAAIPGDLLARRPDVREAEWKLASAAGQETLAGRAFFPTFTLQPGVGLSKSADVTSSSWSLGLGATVPVLDIPRLRAQLNVRRALSDQAVLAYEQVVQRAYAEAETAFVYLDSDTRRVALLQAAERNAAKAYEAKRIGYSRGFNDLQTALSAETTWLQSRQTLAQAQTALMQRSVQVFKAVGGGWTSAAPGATAQAVGLSAR